MSDKKLLLIISSKPAVIQQLNHNLKPLQLVFTETNFTDLTEISPPPLALVIDLELENALEEVTVYKQKWPKTFIAGFVSRPMPELWVSAEEAGCDLVSSRGALAKQFVQRLEIWIENPGGRQIRLLSMKDIAGRLGLVMRLEDSPVGPLAIYHIGGKLFAAQDNCPHAGASLSKGALSMRDKVITCPQHGSQFNISTEERLRGPSDDRIKIYKIHIDGTQAFLKLDPSH